MFYLIGAAHRVQSSPKNSDDSEDQKAYRACLRDAIGRTRPVLVAEEFSTHALTKARKNDEVEHESITKAVADSLAVAHRFCDPGPEDRKRIGYVEGGELFMPMVMADQDGLTNEQIETIAFATEVAKYWPLREKFWLDQLGDVIDKSVIFICGDAHLESFQQLVAGKATESQIIARHIGVNQSDDAFWGRVLAYVSAHPELKK
jgi:hypothetical protein